MRSCTTQCPADPPAPLRARRPSRPRRSPIRASRPVPPYSSFGFSTSNLRDRVARARGSPERATVPDRVRFTSRPARPRHVRADDRALGVGEQRRVPLVGEHGEERLLVRRSCSGACWRRRPRAARKRPAAPAHSSRARDDVVDQHAAIDEIDRAARRRVSTPSVERQLARIADHASARRSR